MHLPIQITFRKMDTSPSVEAHIRERAEALEKFYDRITHCRVVVEAPHRHHRQGDQYLVRIDLTVPGGETIVVSHEASEHAGVAVREAFDVARRRLEDYVKDRRDSPAPLVPEEPEEEEPASVT